MKQIRGYAFVAAVVLGISGVLLAASGTYSPTVFYRDVSVGTWLAVSNITAAPSSNSAGTYTDGVYTVYYRANGTNREGRLPASAVATLTWTNIASTAMAGPGAYAVSNAAGAWAAGTHTNYYRVSGSNGTGRLAVSPAITSVWTTTANASNTLYVHWSSHEGLDSYVVERSPNNSAWTQWVAVASGTTNLLDYGTNAWTGTRYTNVITDLVSATQAAVVVRWSVRDGVSRYVLEHSTDNTNWTNWTTFAWSTTNTTDYGTNAWTETLFTNLYSPISAPTVPWATSAAITGLSNEVDAIESATGTWTTASHTALVTTNDTRAMTFTAGAYISGAWAHYVDTNTVAITNGDGYCAGKYFNVAVPIEHDMTSLVVGYDMHYIYLSHGASTFPSTLIVYDSTNEPVRSAAYGGGWYAGTSSMDRCLGAVAGTNGAAELQRFVRSVAGYYLAGDVQHGASPTLWVCAYDMNPNSAWQVPDEAQASTYLPLNAFEASFLMHALDTGADVQAALTSTEMFDSLTSNSIFIGSLYFEGGHTRIYPQFTVKLGPSRNVMIGGNDNDDNNLAMYVNGWREQR